MANFGNIYINIKGEFQKFVGKAMSKASIPSPNLDIPREEN